MIKKSIVFNHVFYYVFFVFIGTVYNGIIKFKLFFHVLTCEVESSMYQLSEQQSINITVNDNI